MIDRTQLGHSFAFTMTRPGQVSAYDLTDSTLHDLQILQIWGDAEAIFILSERANYSFRKSKNEADYILTRVVLITMGTVGNSGLYLPGAEVYEWEGEDGD